MNRHEDARPAIGLNLLRTGWSDDGPLGRLTPREQEVLRMYLTILNDKKVARELGTRPQTVRNQLATIEHKLGAGSRAELVSMALSLSEFRREPKE